jgi:hypothetical protein
VGRSLPGTVAVLVSTIRTRWGKESALATELNPRAIASNRRANMFIGVLLLDGVTTGNRRLFETADGGQAVLYG